MCGLVAIYSQIKLAYCYVSKMINSETAKVKSMRGYSILSITVTSVCVYVTVRVINFSSSHVYITDSLSDYTHDGLS